MFCNIIGQLNFPYALKEAFYEGKTFINVFFYPLVIKFYSIP